MPTERWSYEPSSAADVVTWDVGYNDDLAVIHLTTARGVETDLLQGVDLVTGETAWSIEVPMAFDLTVVDDDVVALASRQPVAAEEGGRQEILLFDPASGEELAAGLVDGMVVEALGADTSGVYVVKEDVVRRVGTDLQISWERRAGAQITFVHPTADLVELTVQTTEGGTSQEEFVDPSSGATPPWFDQGEEGTSYEAVGDVVMRTGDGWVERLGVSGEVLWDAAAERAHLLGAGSGEVAVLLQAVDPGGEVYLELVEPETGELIWERSVAGLGFPGWHTDEVVVFAGHGEEGDLLSLATGDRIGAWGSAMAYSDGFTLYGLEGRVLSGHGLKGDLWAVPSGGASQFEDGAPVLITRADERIVRWG